MSEFVAGMRKWYIACYMLTQGNIVHTCVKRQYIDGQRWNPHFRYDITGRIVYAFMNRIA